MLARTNASSKVMTNTAAPVHKRRFTLGVAAALSIVVGGSACTRPTVGYCVVEEDCELNQFCSLPEQECVTATVIRGEFSGSQALPPTASDRSGSFVLRISSDQSVGNWTLSHDLPNPTILQLRAGKIGQGNIAGIPLAQLDPAQKSGTLPLDPDRVRALIAGDLYLVMGSASFPNGELRAQLIGSDPAQAQAGSVRLIGQLSGQQTAPSNPSRGNGIISVDYNETAGTLNYNFNMTGLDGGITGLHIHRGGFNINGKHVLDLPTVSQLSSNGTVDTSTVYKEQRQLMSLLLRSGLTYFNVHTSNVSTGELRAQLLPTKALPFNVALTPAMGVSSAALGEIALFLDESQTRVAFRITHTITNPLMGISLLRGATDLTVLCPDLQKSMGTSGAQGSCPLGTAPAGPQLTVADLMSGAARINIQTKVAAMGELTGVLKMPPITQ